MINKEKKQIKSQKIVKFKAALKNTVENIEKEINKNKTLTITKINEILKNNNDTIWKEDFDSIYTYVFKTSYFFNHELIEVYFLDFLINYLTLVKKNFIIKYFYNKIKNNNYSNEDLITIMLFLTIFFRIKTNKNWKIIEINTKEVENKIKKNKKEIIQKIKENLENFYDKTNYLNDSIFVNQLIKYIQQKQKKEDRQKEITISNENMEILQENNIEDVEDYVEIFGGIKEQILETIIIETKDKKKLKEEQYLIKVIKNIWKEIAKKEGITVDLYYNAFLNWIIEEIKELFKKF